VFEAVSTGFTTGWSSGLAWVVAGFPQAQPSHSDSGAS